jgi:hypothetical protein
MYKVFEWCHHRLMSQYPFQFFDQRKLTQNDANDANWCKWCKLTHMTQNDANDASDASDASDANDAKWLKLTQNDANGANWRKCRKMTQMTQIDVNDVWLPFFHLFLVCNSWHWLHSSSIWCRGSNPWPLDREPSVLTTRPWLSPVTIPFIFCNVVILLFQE